MAKPAIKEVKYCPVTGNQPLKCSRKSFLRSCTEYRNRLKKKTGTDRTHPYCGICNGKMIPGEVEFVDLMATQAAEVITMDKRRHAPCESCGSTTSRTASHGKMVCNSCGVVRTKAKNAPEIVANAMLEFNSIEHLANLMNLPGVESDISEIAAKLEVAERQLDDVGEANTKLHDRIRHLEAENLSLKTTGGISNDKLGKILAMAAIDGTIPGVTTEQLAALWS